MKGRVVQLVVQSVSAVSMGTADDLYRVFFFSSLFFSFTIDERVTAQTNTRGKHISQRTDVTDEF